MKKGSEFYEMMPTEIKELYKINLVSFRGEFDKHFMRCKFDNFEDFLLSSFMWRDTPQGHVFWQDISDKYI